MFVLGPAQWPATLKEEFTRPHMEGDSTLWRFDTAGKAHRAVHPYQPITLRAFCYKYIDESDSVVALVDTALFASNVALDCE